MISLPLLPLEVLLLCGVLFIYAYLLPFNKVEESFNTQAVHDFVFIFPHRVFPVSNFTSSNLRREVAFRSEYDWDHREFPGVVPRTFIGALLVALPSKLFRAIYQLIEKDASREDLGLEITTSIISRLVLSFYWIVSYSALSRAVQKRYGSLMKVLFMLTTLSQFHYVFYSNRLLPNTFAAILSNFVLACWIRRRYSQAIVAIAFSIVIFRFDTAIFYFWLLADAVFVKKTLSLRRLLMVGIPAGLVALISTILFDSIMWGRLVWPEFEGLYFNVWLNKSHEWGVQPFYWYVYNCLPRMLMASTPFLFLAQHKVTRDYLIPVLCFILSYSLLPHKEMRFILFIGPYLNICVVSGLITLRYYIDQFSSFLKIQRLTKFFFGIVVLAVLTLNISASLMGARISSYNYPGGEAAIKLASDKTIRESSTQSIQQHFKTNDLGSSTGVYVNNLAAQTGFSRFLHADGIYYSKSPHFGESSFQKSYTYVVLILEPDEALMFARNYCTSNPNRDNFIRALSKNLRDNKQELTCALPKDKKTRVCSIINTVNTFDSINISALLRQIGQISLWSWKKVFDDSRYIRTRMSLHLIRCYHD